MLTRLRLESFKSFAEADAPFGPLTLLVGANASGKTNALEALRLLAALLGGLDPLDHALRDTGIVRGGAREIARNGSDTFTICSTWRARTGRFIEHELIGSVRPELQIRSERLVDEQDLSVWLQASAQLGVSAGPGGRPAELVSRVEWPVSSSDPKGRPRFLPPERRLVSLPLHSRQRRWLGRARIAGTQTRAGVSGDPSICTILEHHAVEHARLCAA